MYFYVLRVPYVHHVYGKDMVKLLEKAYDKMTIGRGGENIVREEPNVVPTQMDPMSLVEQEEEPEPELEHSDNGCWMHRNLWLGQSDESIWSGMRNKWRAVPI